MRGATKPPSTLTLLDIKGDSRRNPPTSEEVFLFSSEKLRAALRLGR
jgi:hypothetical protein